MGMEVGIGSGKFAAPLGIRIGVEPAQAMADKARGLGLTVYPGVAEALPFCDARFDWVLMVTTICFVDDLPRAFAEAFRVLRPGGCILVGFVDRESDLGKRYQDKRQRSKFYLQATFFSTLEVQAHLEAAGFVIAETVQTLLPGEASSVIQPGYGQGAFVVVKGLQTGSRGDKLTLLRQ